jgi:hypothetical protein
MNILPLIILTFQFLFSIGNFQVSARGDSRTLLVLAAPDSTRGYYANDFNSIVNFQVEYAQKVIDNGADDIVIIVNDKILPYYSRRLPSKILLVDYMADIWMRDFTLVNPSNPVSFVYTWASMTKGESIKTQQSFINFASHYGLNYKKVNYMIDGGNIVDTFDGKVFYFCKILVFL